MAKIVAVLVLTLFLQCYHASPHWKRNSRPHAKKSDISVRAGAVNTWPLHKRQLTHEMDVQFQSQDNHDKIHHSANLGKRDFSDSPHMHKRQVLQKKTRGYPLVNKRQNKLGEPFPDHRIEENNESHELQRRIFGNDIEGQTTASPFIAKGKRILDTTFRDGQKYMLHQNVEGESHELQRRIFGNDIEGQTTASPFIAKGILDTTFRDGQNYMLHQDVEGESHIRQRRIFGPVGIQITTSAPSG